MAEYQPRYLDNNYDDNQKKVIPLPPEKIAQEGYFGVEEALSEGTPDFGYCVQTFASAISADLIRSGGEFLAPDDFVCQFVLDEKAFPLPLYIENKQSGAKMSTADPLSLYGLLFGFLYMHGLITASGMERVGKRAHELSDKGDMTGSIMLPGSVIDDLRGMFNQGPKALYDLWIKQLAEYYYIEWDRDDPKVGKECLALTKEGVDEDGSTEQEFKRSDSEPNNKAREGAHSAPTTMFGRLKGLFGRQE